MKTELLLSLWGKTDREDALSYHPLLFHMLDVAHVTECIWDDCLPLAMRRRFAASLNLPESDTRALIVFLAGLHDIGKASPPFQSQYREGRTRLTSLGFTFPDAKSNVRHGEISAFCVEKMMSDGALATYGRKEALVLARIIGGHHGIFPSPSQRTGATVHIGDAAWEEARGAVAQCLIQSLGLTLPVGIGTITDSGIVPLLAGFVSVADWLGSSEEFFPASSGTDLSGYIPQSRESALRVLTATGWLPKLSQPDTPRIFSDIFPFKPNTMQSAVAEIADQAQSSYLIIVEEQMGGGKTEASLFCADRVRLRRQSGFYIALPTQATSNAMFSRLRKDYLHGEPLLLVHGSAMFSEDYRPFHQADERGRRDEAIAEVGSWFTARKRPLLASFGVGTIDQSLMAVLQTKHWFVRLFGLAGKTVVFDEVHAYDVYMTDILKRLVRWLAELGCTVVILSATLPKQRRLELVRAFSGDEDLEWNEYEYPRLTVFEGHQARSVKLPPAESTIIYLSRKNDDPASLPGIIRESLPDGGCGVVICNTVSRAQEVFRILRADLEGWDVLLFHARFPAKRRREIEEQVLRLFGKEGKDRPSKAVLVATQVVEQSLDLDFDWMASDFAPVDLLLQRAGRMWRHDRDARPVPKPVLTLLCGGDATQPEFGPSVYVYAKYVLMRSWISLLNRESLSIPDDIESLVESVYQDDEGPVPSNLKEQLEEARQEFDLKKLHDETKARDVLVTFPRRPSIVLEKFNADLADDEDPNVHESVRAATRLGRPSIQLICLEERDGNLCPLVGSDGDPVNLEKDPDALTVRRLLDSAVPVSSYPIVRALREPSSGNRPDNWRRNPHLRHCRLVVFQNGISELAGKTLRLSDDFGLEIISGSHEEDE